MMLLSKKPLSYWLVFTYLTMMIRSWCIFIYDWNLCQYTNLSHIKLDSIFKILILHYTLKAIQNDSVAWLNFCVWRHCLSSIFYWAIDKYSKLIQSFNIWNILYSQVNKSKIPFDNLCLFSLNKWILKIKLFLFYFTLLLNFSTDFQKE